MYIAENTAIITGGGSGLGAATARLLALYGARVALLDINRSAAEDVADSIGGVACTCDVTDEASVRAAFAKAEAVHGPARIVVNCAGVLGAGRILGREGPMKQEDFMRTLAINVGGTFNVMKLAAAAMQELSTLAPDGECGVIINTASIAAYEGQIGQAAYAASKGAVASLTLPAARELSRIGIRVMAIAPGPVDTPMVAGMTPELRESLEASIPFPSRLIMPEEYASLVRHIIENPALNGEVIRLDGAMRLPIK
ncbi:MAG: SDR family NAD(P)-dependent oxidoreductase [Rickettsiales bacterium]|nr:SDR family NAD(P)-dependent oxidoreductase [Rickettsiales bacterium]